MSATHRVLAVESFPEKPETEACAAVGMNSGAAVRQVREVWQPALRVVPLLRPTQPRRFARVPTHAVGIHPEQREYPRAALNLPLRLRSVNHVPEQYPITLVTRNISSTGVYFLSPKLLALQTPIELEIVLVSRPMGRGNVVVVTKARVRRIESVATPGWHGIACSFDDVQFDRDDSIPSRYLHA